MSLLSEITKHLQEHRRDPQQIDESTVSFIDQLKSVEATINVTEPVPDHIVGYTPYFPPLKGEPENLLALDNILMRRNAQMTGVTYARTEDDYTLLKGDFHAAESMEESVRRFDDLWVDLRDQLENLPEDYDLLRRLDLEPKL